VEREKGDSIKAIYDHDNALFTPTFNLHPSACLLAYTSHTAPTFHVVATFSLPEILENLPLA